MISTFHTDYMMVKRRRTKAVTEGVETVQKPVAIDDYNLHMGGVDKSDQLVLYYGYSHRSRKWWKRIFFHLLDLSIVNASILYNTVAEKSLNQLDFRLSLVASLLEGHKRLVDRRHVAPTRVLPMRLSERAFPEPIRKETPSGGRPQCEVCRARRKKDLRHNFNVKSAKHHYTSIRALKYTTQSYIMKVKNIAYILYLSFYQKSSQSYKYNLLLYQVSIEYNVKFIAFFMYYIMYYNILYYIYIYIQYYLLYIMLLIRSNHKNTHNYLLITRNHTYRLTLYINK